MNIERFSRDGVTLAYAVRPGTTPSGPSFIFQHGMGGSIEQPMGYIGDDPVRTTVCLAARGHTPSDDLDRGGASFDVFADDVIALADHLGLARFVAGGISMGAGTAINLAVRYPDRVAGLVLCRPAWLAEPQAPANRAAYAEIADLLDECDALAADGTIDTSDAAEAYRHRATYREAEQVSPAAAASLFGQITRSRAVENAVLLRRLPADAPTRHADQWAEVQIPALIIAHHDDPFHPYSIAADYAEILPNARLVTVPSKDADPAAFAVEIRAALQAFLAHADLA